MNGTVWHLEHLTMEYLKLYLPMTGLVKWIQFMANSIPYRAQRRLVS